MYFTKIPEGCMFHKFKKPTIIVNKYLVYPVRIFFALFVIYFMFDLNEMLSSGVAEYSYSVDSIRGEDNFRFWLKFTEKLVMGVFFLLLIFNIKSSK
jgi:hypothetical protein